MRWLRKIDTILDGWCPLLIPLALLTILKLPSFFEPYWYGDEAIYLTIGNALRAGSRLYAEIIDHKTPLIYYFAMTPHQLWFRVVMFAWMVMSTYLFFGLSKDVIGILPTQGKKQGLQRLLIEWPTLVTTLIFVLLTSTPIFEGNIPNGELFVMGWILLGWWWLRKSTLYRSFIDQETHHSSSNNTFVLLFGGALAGLGVLTKVPGLFDAAAIISVPALMAWNTVLNEWKSPKKWWSTIQPYVNTTLVTLVGLVSIIFLSVVYYTLRGSLPEYIDFGLLYNFRYAGYWALPTSNQLLITLLSFGGKAAVMFGSLTVLALFTKQTPLKLQFILAWCWLALFASLLSNRPYPHYFLQLVLPVSLLLGYCVKTALEWLGPKRTTLLQLNLIPALQTIWFCLVAYIAVTTVGVSLGIERLNSSAAYYSSFVSTVLGRKSWTEYSNSFDALVADNTRASAIISEAGVDQIFIWGTNPSLYAQTGTYPTGRFTVAFHIKDFNAYQESFDSVVEKGPKFVVVMKQEENFQELQTYLQHNYIPNDSFTHFVLWQRYSDVK